MEAPLHPDDEAPVRGSGRRRPSLTPMVDVVFLLLVFFMLAAQTGIDRTLDLAPGGATASSGEPYRGAPRYVTVSPEALRLNGRALALDDLAPALRPLMPDAGATVVVAARGGADLQQVVVVLDRLDREGFANIVLAE